VKEELGLHTVSWLFAALQKPPHL